MTESRTRTAILLGERKLHTVTEWDGGLACRAITREFVPANGLLQLIAERIRIAAGYLPLSKADLERIFTRHDVFEVEMRLEAEGQPVDFILVETYHHIQGMTGKGALKLIYPKDLLEEGEPFRDAGQGSVEVVPPNGKARWTDVTEAEKPVKRAMREFMTGETLSMSLKSQATGAPFAGSEGLVLCALREFDPQSGRYFLRQALKGGPDFVSIDRELLELIMNEAAAVLTRAGRIGFDLIVHAAETNSTLTAGLGLQLPTNVVEGHLRALLEDEPGIIIGDDDMTARLREILERPGYRPTACSLARAAARMQMEHSVLLPSSRDRLRKILALLPQQGTPTAQQYRDTLELLFGRGETQQTEDQLFHGREPVLKSLSIALSARSLDECGEADVLAFYLRTLLDNQRIMLEAALLNRLPPEQALPMDWFERAPLLSKSQERVLRELMPNPGVTRDKVKENFWEIVRILAEAKAELPRYSPDPQLQARKEVLERASRAITSSGDAVPSCERIVFFLLPYTYECVTPRLGVVTRKPAAICGSELRPEAMAAGGVLSLEIFLKKLTGKARPLEGLSVAIEGLGNAGKHVATSVLQRGAKIVGVSDSRGCLLCEDGFSREELAVIIAHKNSGRRLDTILKSPAGAEFGHRPGKPMTFVADPEKLHQAQADILVLAAISGTVNARNADALRVKVVCELTGAGVSGEAKRRLKEREVHVIPDNLASSGGLLVSLYEMLQNSAGQNWHRELEENRLRLQLSKSFDAVMKQTEALGVDMPTASDIVALQRMHELALYREALEGAAHALEQRVRAIGPQERVLVVSDDDEDGVGSAAIMHALLAALNPGAEKRVSFMSESLRSEGVVDRVLKARAEGMPFENVFVLDRALPLNDAGKARVARLRQACRLTIVNNNRVNQEWFERLRSEFGAQFGYDNAEAGSGNEGVQGGQGPEANGDSMLFISPQTLKAAGRAREFSTALTLRELAHTMLKDKLALARIDWQAAVASCLDVPDEASNEWLWFFTQFNPDRTLEAARAVRMVTRAGGFLNAVNALASVRYPERLETHVSWHHFIREFALLNERVQVLVDKIVVENRSRPFTAHFFTEEELASPTPVAGDASNILELHHWISEHLTRRGNLAEKPIIMGQVVRDGEGREALGVRIRSPRGVDLMEAGLPPEFGSGGLPNTAIARLSLQPGMTAEQQFQQLLDQIWMKATNPIYLAASAGQGWEV